MMLLDASVARARGLSTHLLSAAAWRELTAVPDLEALAQRLASGPDPVVLPAPHLADPAELERLVRRRAGRRLRLLAHWCADVPGVLTILLGDEERRTLRGLVRGVVEGAAPRLRLAGALPTPLLPESALELLAAQPTLAAMASLLTAWSHPDAGVLGGVPVAGPPDLLQLEMSLARAWAARATAAARASDASLQHYLEQTVDLENALAAVTLSGTSAELEAASLAIPGGRHLPGAAVERIARTGSRGEGLEVAAEILGGTELEAAFTEVSPAAVRERASRLLLAWARSVARESPLGSAPLIAYVLGLREEVKRLQRLIWGLALEAPVSQRGGAS